MTRILRMRSLQLFGDRDLRITEIEAPPPPAPGEVQVRVKALALNYLDVWGFRGMAFAKRKMPQAVGVEASGEIAAVGEGVTRFKAGDPVTMYGAETCGHCKACREGLGQSLRERRRHHGLPYRRLRPRADQPAGAARDPGAEGRVLRGGGLRAHRLRHRAAHAVRQRQAGAGRVDPRPCGRLRHRHRGDQDGEGHRLHGLYDGRRRREGREGKGARRRLRRQLPHRALRGRGPPAHQAQRRRRGVRACGRRDLERLPALPQARRAPRHLRLDVAASPRP